MKFALRAPILKYTLFGMLFLNSPAQASEPCSERMEKSAAEVIAADSAAIPKGWDNDCRASYKAGYEAGYRAGYLHGRRTATQPHSSGRASATRYADGSIVQTRDTTASGRRFMHRIGAEFRPEYIFPTNPFVEGENRAGQPIDLSLSGHLRYSFQFRPGSIPDQIYGGAYQGIGAAYYDFGNPDELGNPIAVYLFQGARIARISPRLSFNYEWNFGLSFGWKPYDDAVNPLNKMMGSKMNAYLNADFFLDWRVTREVDFTAGLRLTHFSNGNTTIPNAGLNSAGLQAGLTCNFGRTAAEARVARRIDGPDFRPHMTYDLVLFGSWRRKGVAFDGNQYASPDAYTVLGVNFAAMYNFGYKFRAGLSLDGIYDGSANVYIPDQITAVGDSPDLEFVKPGIDRQLALGLSARAEFVMPYFTIGIGLGRNILHKGGDMDYFYQTLALKVGVTRNSFVHIGYSLSDFHMPNFLMLGAGWRFNNRSPHHY